MTATKSTPTLKAKHTDADIIARLIPRSAITYVEARGTFGKVECYDVRSQRDATLIYRASYTLHSRTYWCECQGFTGHGYCKHTDSIAYYMAVDTARARCSHWDDARLMEEEAQLRGVIADMGSLGWPGMAELDAIGDELAARLDDTIAA